MAEAFRNMLIHWGRPAVIAESKEQEREMQQLALFLRDATVFDTRELMKKANDMRAPLLVAYQADGWSGKISYYRRHTGAANHLLVTREKTEFSLQRLLAKMRQNDKEVAAMQFAEPRPLLHGVSAAEFFVAYNDFAPCVRRLNQHLVLQWFTFDGGLLSRMMRRCRGKQQLLYQDEELFRALLPGPRSEMDDDAAERCRRLEGRDFCFGMQCLSHVFSNANKWGLSHVSSPESLDDLHIAIAAARQSSTTLLRSLPQFVLSRVTFEEPDWDTTTWLQIQALWNFLLDDARMVHDIMELNPRWGRQRDRLLVSTGFRAGLAMPAYERMESILAYCCRWEDFTLTRWSSVSRACRLWVASLLVGLDGQMESLTLRICFVGRKFLRANNDCGFCTLAQREQKTCTERRALLVER
jgi:hypothetical protein